MIFRTFIFLSFLTLALSSCSLFTGGSSESPEDASDMNQEAMTGEDLEAPSLSKVPIEELPQSDGSSSNDTSLDKVEILWKIPEEAADGFIMHYGFAADALTYRLRLQTSEIEQYQDPQFGPVFRYIIADLPPEKTVYISLQTIRGDVVSEPSEVFEVAP